MHNKSIRGSLVALITPFTKDGSIDYKAYEALLKLHTESKTDGLVICGTTGEAATLTLDEKKSLLKTAKDFTKGKIPIIFGTGGNDTKSVVSLTKDAASYGADAVLVVTPYITSPQAGLIAHIKRLRQQNCRSFLYVRAEPVAICCLKRFSECQNKEYSCRKRSIRKLGTSNENYQQGPKGFGLFSEKTRFIYR